MGRTKKTMGKGAVVSCLARMLHPSQIIAQRFPTINKNKRLEKLIVLQKENRKIKKKEYKCVVVQSNEVMDGDNHVELYASLRHFCVVTAGSPINYFNETVMHELGTQNNAPEEQQTDLPPELLHRLETLVLDKNDIALLSCALETNSDNDLAPENIPITTETAECFYAEDWGHHGVCNWRKTGAHNLAAQRVFPIGFRPTLLENFEMLFPKQFIVEDMIPQMNKVARLGVIQYGEFMQWLGLWFLMGTANFGQRIRCQFSLVLHSA